MTNTPKELREWIFRELVERSLLLDTTDEPIDSLEHDFASEMSCTSKIASILLALTLHMVYNV